MAALTGSALAKASASARLLWWGRASAVSSATATAVTKVSARDWRTWLAGAALGESSARGFLKLTIVGRAFAEATATAQLSVRPATGPAVPIYLVEIIGYSATYRFASGQGYDNAGTFYAPRLENPGTFTRDFGSDTGGRASTSKGEITLSNIDGALNALCDDFFDGRTVTLKRGYANADYSTFTTICVSTMETVSFERERVSIKIRDKALSLDKPFSSVKYAGNNVLPAGVEGSPDDIKDHFKPRIFGRIALFEPILVNTSKLIYQVNNGAVDAIVNVFDSGAYLTRGTDYTSQADMEANDPADGNFRCWPAGGYFRLGSSPYGTIAACVAEKWAYTSNTAASLIQRILTEKGLTSSDWVAADFTLLDQKNAGSIGIVVADEESTASIIDRICQSVGAWWGFDQLNRFRVARFEAPTGSPVATFTDAQDLEIEREPEEKLPIWSAKIRADVNYSVQQKSALAGVVTDARANWLTQETRDQKIENATVKTTRLLADEATYDSVLNGISTAAAEAQRRLNLYSVRRDTIKITVADPASLYGTITLGSVVSVSSSKFGYGAGKLFTVIGLAIDYKSNTLDLKLWG